jgi:outer membrane protein assembly factor BamB
MRPQRLAFVTLLALAAAFLCMTAPAHAETIKGTFNYLDRNPADGTSTLRPIVNAKVEIWSCTQGWTGLCVWANARTVKTDSSGSISAQFTHTGTATYGVKVFAENDAAVVWPKDVAHLLPFYQEPGQPDGAVINKVAKAAGDVLDFSYDFTEFWASAHYNIADAVLLARNFIDPKRDPADASAEPLPRASIQPNSYPNWLGGKTYYNYLADSVNIGDDRVFNDTGIVHEYSHFVEEQISSFAPIASLHFGCPAFDGLGNEITDPDLAWMEGFAEWFSARLWQSLPPGRLGGLAGVGTTPPLSLETPPTPCAIAATKGGDAIEDFVAGALWDLTDKVGERLNDLSPGSRAARSVGPETRDNLSGFDTQIIQILDHELDTYGHWPTITDFRQAWHDRGLPDVGLGEIFLRNEVTFRRDYVPTANAGPDQTVKEGSTVTLDGSGSTDPELTPLTNFWKQLSGPPVTISSTGAAQPTFVAPQVSAAGATLVFRLSVVDGSGKVGADDVQIAVEDVKPSPSLSPSNVAFGLRKLWTTGTKTVTLANGGPGMLDVGAISVSGVGDFWFSSTTCGSTLAAGGSCTIDVAYGPFQEGASTSILRVMTPNAWVASVTAALSGTGGQPVSSVDKSQLPFGPTYLGGHVSDDVQLSNTGTAPLDVSVTSWGSTQFKISSACPSSLPAGGTCKVTVTFAPTALGPATGVLRFVTDGGGPHDVALSGSGSPIGMPTVVPNILSFGTADVGAKAQPLTVALGNTGTAPFTVNDVGIVGGHWNDFVVTSDHCKGVTLSHAVSGSCTVTVLFAPRASGPRASLLLITTSAGQARVDLRGTGRATVATTDWQQLGFSADRSSANGGEFGIDTASASTLHAVWQAATGGPVRTSAAVVGKLAFWGSDDGSVYAADAGAGAQLWSANTKGPVRSSPAVADGLVYAGSDDGNVYALDAGSGKTVWTYLTHGPVSSSPAVVDGAVYVGSQDGVLYAINAYSGTLLWSQPLGAPTVSSPAVAGGVVYIGADNNRVRAFEAKSGAALWTAFTAGPVRSTPAVGGGRVFVGAAGRLYAFDAATGSQAWSLQTGLAAGASPAYAQGVVYLGSDSGVVQAIGAANGNGIWIRPAAATEAAPAIANGVLYAVGDDGTLRAVDAWSGADLAEWHTNGLAAAPAVAGGTVYVGSLDGSLYALQP